MRKDSSALQRNRLSDWVRAYKTSASKYHMNTLLAVLETDGEQMLEAVLKELGLTMSVNLVKDAKTRE